MPEKEHYDSGFTFQGFFGMSPEEKTAYEKEHPFPYQSIEEYIDAVVEWLQTSSWKYNKEQALRCIKDNQKMVYEFYEQHVPVDLCGADAGYGCG